MNPNVAIELGYALCKHSDEKILMVLNRHYGGREYLPFDLRQKAGPIEFNLPPDAPKKTRETEARSLRKQFEVAIRPFLVAPSKPATNTFRKAPSTYSQAVYFKQNEILAHSGRPEDNEVYVFLNPSGEGFSLRLYPRSGLLKPFAGAFLERKVREHGLDAFGSRPGCYPLANQYGAISVDILTREPGAKVVLAACTQVFRSGELWGFAPWLLKDNEYGRYIPSRALERAVLRTLNNYVGFAVKHLELSPPFIVELGAVGLNDRHITSDPQQDDWFGPIRDDTFSHDVELTDTTPSAIKTAAIRLFKELHLLTGYPRPD